MHKKLEALLIHAIIYSTVITACWIALNYWLNYDSIILNLYLSNLTGCLIVFLNCVIFDSFSINDPFWTLEASCFSIYYLYNSQNSFESKRTIIVFILINVWSIRLTLNLLINSVENINHEDWRFSIFRKKWSPKYFYFIMGFISFILLPDFLVFFGSVPMNYIFSSTKDLNLIDLVAFLITFNGILFETIADYQLQKKLSSKNNEKSLPCMDKGLWSLCRHPNYFGEISFWFGLYIFGIASNFNLITDKFYLMTFLLGPLGIFFLIYFGSMPLMEQRQLKRRGEFYKNYIKNVPFKIFPLNFIFFNYKKNISKKNVKKN